MGSEEIGSIHESVEDMSICSVDPFYSCGWGPNFIGNCSLVHQNEFADNNPQYGGVMSDNHTMGNSSHLVRNFGSETFSRMVSHENSEDGALGSLPNAKRKRENVEVKQRNDKNVETCDFPKEDDKNLRGKQVAGKTKADANSAEPSKENYILVRAKRGQATNSHSLAERLRREKISERMKLLQELVPGCNKITGKAVMLDEIINYVQSLQQQVEFLSMKLATVNPELNVDIERVLTKDLLHPQVGLGPGFGSSHAFTGLHSSTALPYHPLPPNLWNNELQSILQPGFDSNSSLGGLGANGLSKMDL